MKGKFVESWGFMLDQTNRGRILVVEDEMIILEMLERLLTRAGFEVEVAETGDHAYELLQTYRYDVVLTDIMMPGALSGIDLLAYIKQEFPETSVIMYTAHHRAELTEASRELNADDYLLKPVDNQVLRDSIIRGVELAQYRKQHP